MKLLFAVVASLVMTVGSAIAQQNTVNLAAIEAVQKDLGVNDEVARKLTSLNGEYRAAIQATYQGAGLNPIFNPNQLTAEQRLQHVEIGRKLNDEFIPKAKELLSADQNKRLQQIEFQLRFRNLGTMALLAPEVASELKLTDDQKQNLNTLERERRQSLFPAGVSTKGKEAIERLTKHREEYQTKAIEVLTAEQTETLNRLKGKEFDLSKLVNPRPMAKGTN